MKLYGSLTSPYVRKLRILLREKSISCEFSQADAWAADSPVPRFNPLGKVPVLERDDGSALYDSPVILEYVDSLKAPALLAPAGEERWAMLRLQALADGILDATVTRLLESRRPQPQQSAENLKRQEEKITRALASADSMLKGEAYLMQNRFTVADLCLGVALEYVDFRYPHDWRSKHPRLALWLAGISTRPAFAETLPPGMERAPQLPH
ncbi:MAG: glutathione S-transferase N-terminal domain-containing protein [Gammaproteobacteria bacterium]|nr:glutathione S-transferase N-terminal domain-containing protein [Gammaproteobacteria bacterium]